MVLTVASDCRCIYFLCQTVEIFIFLDETLEVFTFFRSGCSGTILCQEQVLTFVPEVLTFRSDCRGIYFVGQAVEMFTFR